MSLGPSLSKNFLIVASLLAVAVIAPGPAFSQSLTNLQRQRAQAVGIGAAARCLVRIGRLTSAQARVLVLRELNKKGLNTTKDWLMTPNANEVIVKLSPYFGADCKSPPDAETFGRIAVPYL